MKLSNSTVISLFQFQTDKETEKNRKRQDIERKRERDNPIIMRLIFAFVTGNRGKNIVLSSRY